MLEFVRSDLYGKAFGNCFPTRVAHGPGGLIALEHYSYGVSRIFHKRDDGRVTYIEGRTDIYNFDALFDDLKHRYGLTEDKEEPPAPDLPEITVKVVHDNSRIDVFVNGSHVYGHNAKRFLVSRELTVTTHERGDGIFDEGTSIVFWRNDEEVAIGGLSPLPEKPNVGDPEAEWREWATEFKRAVQERIIAVKSAFSEDFEFSV